MAPFRKAGYTLLEMIVVIAILAILMGLILPAVQKIREAAARTQCLNHLKQIGLALHEYHGTFGHFPEGVSNTGPNDPHPFMSWNTQLLPFLEESGLWDQAEQAFQQYRDFHVSPPHLLATLNKAYVCPSDPRTQKVGLCNGNTLVAFTDYLGVEGVNQVRKDGVLFLNSEVRFADVTDGTSNTLLVGERPPSSDLRFGWWYAGLGQADDGSAEMVIGVREFNVRQPDLCPDRSPYGPGRDDNLCDMFHFWSHHPGGALFAFADGSVHFLNYSAEPLMAALATRAGGEPSPAPD